MGIIFPAIICDGCGLPAAPEHIAERLGRLELATRFRPIHINTLIVSLSPMEGVENDFYGPPTSKDFFNSLMDSARIIAAPEESSTQITTQESDTAKLIEFQRRGYYVSYLAECPIPAGLDAADSAISRLGTRLVLRIRHNYKPKHIAVWGSNLLPLIELLEKSGLGPILQTDRGQRLTIPEASDPSDSTGFKDALTAS